MSIAPYRIPRRLSFPISSSSPSKHSVRRFSLWAMKKDQDLEKALSRNRRWMVNNQIKNIILRYPDEALPIDFLQKKFKSLDLQGNALNWLKKYPCCFEVYLDKDKHFCRLTKRMKFLVEEEESVRDSQEPVFVERFTKLLMMSRNHRLNVLKLGELKRNFGLPDDYLPRIVTKYSDIFRLVNFTGRRSSMDVELTHFDPKLAVSAVELRAKREGHEPSFTCSLPHTWLKSWERFRDFNSTPYVSPYVGLQGLSEGPKEMDKRTVALVHELLSLTLWKKASIVKLSHFKREFSLPEKLHVFLLKHPWIFYVSNKYKIHTVLLREAYEGCELIEKDPLVVVKEKFGELMEDGAYERNHRHYLQNLEKKKRGFVATAKTNERQRSGKDDEILKQEDDRKGVGIFDPEERKRFYKVLFDDDAN